MKSAHTTVVPKKYQDETGYMIYEKKRPRDLFFTLEDKKHAEREIDYLNDKKYELKKVRIVLVKSMVKTKNGHYY